MALGKNFLHKFVLLVCLALFGTCASACGVHDLDSLLSKVTGNSSDQSQSGAAQPKADGQPAKSDGQQAKNAPQPKLSGELRIVAATELDTLKPALERAARELGFTVSMDAPDGTLANSRALADGAFDGKYDATWFATNRFADLLGAQRHLVNGKSIAHSPVVFGVKSAIAKSHGWDTKQPTWKELSDAHLHFGMTDPATSNSGFSALVAVATAFADTGRSLTEADIAKNVGPVGAFFASQSLTSGSSGWLAQRFKEKPESVDALVNYESVLEGLKAEGQDVSIVVPQDGVISADYPLSALNTPHNPDAKAKVEALSTWFSKHPEELSSRHLRANDGSAAKGDQAKKAQIFELPYPATIATAQKLQEAYTNRLRNPGSTVFVLDTSGSMADLSGNLPTSRIDQLRDTMRSLIDNSMPDNAGFRDRETVSLVPFSTQTYGQVSARVNLADKQSVQPLRARIDSLQPEGFTAIYDALQDAYQAIDASKATIGSIVLMTDGEVTRGKTFAEFQQFYQALPPEKKNIPTFVILYGEANLQEMKDLAQLTGGKTFDALNGNLAQAFKEIRAYQ